MRWGELFTAPRSRRSVRDTTARRRREAKSSRIQLRLSRKVRFLPTCQPIDSSPDFPCKPSPKSPSNQSKCCIAVGNEVSNNERSNTYGGLTSQEPPQSPTGANSESPSPIGRQWHGEQPAFGDDAPEGHRSLLPAAPADARVARTSQRSGNTVSKVVVSSGAMIPRLPCRHPSTVCAARPPKPVCPNLTQRVKVS